MLPADPGHAAVSALAFNAEGERLAALSLVPPTLPPSASGAAKGAGGGADTNVSGVLRVWAVDLGFRQRLQQLRGPVSLEPIVCKSVSGGSYLRGNLEVAWAGPASCILTIRIIDMPTSVQPGVQVALHCSPAGEGDLDLEFRVKWEPSGRVIAIMNAGKVLSMVAC